MPYSVLLTNDAAKDLEDLYNYILLNDTPGKADHVLDQVEKAICELSGMPERGVYPKEIIALGIRRYREVFFNPYRIIYRIHKKKIYIILISDGRRDMQTLLSRRLLES